MILERDSTLQVLRSELSQVLDMVRDMYAREELQSPKRRRKAGPACEDRLVENENENETMAATKPSTAEPSNLHDMLMENARTQPILKEKGLANVSMSELFTEMHQDAKLGPNVDKMDKRRVKVIMWFMSQYVSPEEKNTLTREPDKNSSEWLQWDKVSVLSSLKFTILMTAQNLTAIATLAEERAFNAVRDLEGIQRLKTRHKPTVSGVYNRLVKLASRDGGRKIVLPKDV
jgi:hypothetical protein